MCVNKQADTSIRHRPPKSISRPKKSVRHKGRTPVRLSGGGLEGKGLKGKPDIDTSLKSVNTPVLIARDFRYAKIIKDMGYNEKLFE